MAAFTAESASKSRPGSAMKRLIRVLHVDDDAGLLKVSKRIMEKQGNFQVETALSVDEALEKMKERTFDAVISDYLMPEKDGLELLEELRHRGNNIPFIIFTGKGREEVAIKALNLGADSYFNKIGDLEVVFAELIHAVHYAVERRRALAEMSQKEERLKAIFASCPVGIIISDLQGNILDCNAEALKLAGFSSKEEMIGRNSFEFIAERDRERALQNLRRTFEQGTTKNMEYTLLTENGKEYQGEVSASVLKDSSGNPTGFVGMLRDITRRKEQKR